MGALETIMSALDQKTIAEKVGSHHDSARMLYRCFKNSVDSFDEFRKAIGNYYNYHYSKCVINGGYLAESEAFQQAKGVLEQHYNRKNRGNILQAYNDAHEGTNGGMRVIYDIIADDLKDRATQGYMQNILDLHVEPTSWPQKVEIMEQLFIMYGDQLPASIDQTDPKRYANDFNNIIRHLNHSRQQAFSPFRNL